MNKFTLLSILMLFQLTALRAQVCTQSMRFTWEGDTTGLKAVWKANDTTNTYQINGVDVKVSIEDPYNVNTTTTNPSEFNDYTKSNAYYGPGSLMLQATSTASNQPMCMHFEFSSPVVVQDFRVFDIDFIARGRAVSSFQDSVVFTASMNGKNVPVQLNYLSPSPLFTISGQSATSRYIINTNGDINHTDTRGALTVHSNGMAVNRFTLCYSNGPRDDGRSNSHAIKLVGFDFCSTGFGSIRGMVREKETNIPLAGSTIQLFDTLGQAVLDTLGNPYIADTGLNGLYQFADVPFGMYRIMQTQNPVGYFSYGDTDGANDEMIRTLIDAANPFSINNDFIESNSPLPVEFGGMKLQWTREKEVEISWKTYTERNNDYFTIHVSGDGIHFEPIGKKDGAGNSQRAITYNYVHKPGTSQILYYRLYQTDFDGKETELDLAVIRDNGTISDKLYVYPNPSHDFLMIGGGQEDESSVYNIINSAGQIVQSGRLHTSQVNIQDIQSGMYILQITKGNQRAFLPFQKQ